MNLVDKKLAVRAPEESPEVYPEIKVEGSINAGFDRLKNELVKDGRGVVIENAVQDLIRNNEKNKVFPLKEKALQLAEKFKQENNFSHPAIVPALMSLMSQMVHKEYPRKRNVTPMVSAKVKLSAKIAADFKASLEDGLTEQKGQPNFKSTILNQPGNIPENSPGDTGQNNQQSGQQEPQQPSADSGDRQAVVQLAAKSLEGIQKGIESTVKELAVLLSNAAAYVGDPRSSIEGPIKKQWQDKVSAISGRMKRKIDALNAVCDLALSHL